MNGLSYRLKLNSVLLPKNFQGDAACRGQPKRSNLLAIEFDVAIAFRDPAWPLARPVAITSGHAMFACGITDIVRLGAEKVMFRVAARTHIAGVTDG